MSGVGSPDAEAPEEPAPAPEPASGPAPAPEPAAGPASEPAAATAPATASSPATRAEILGTIAILGVALGIAAWDPVVRLFSAHPSASQCAELLDKYVEHVAHAVDPNPPASALEERKSLARAAAKGREAFRRCEGELTRREVDCAMNAPNADAFERCLPLR
jgi:hypothetical protein